MMKIQLFVIVCAFTLALQTTSSSGGSGNQLDKLDLTGKVPTLIAEWENRAGREENKKEWNSSGEEHEFGPMDEELCRNFAIDVAFNTADSSLYVFRGNQYWLLSSSGQLSRKPGNITSDWPGLPGHMDAAFHWPYLGTYFFKGDKYWRFQNRRPDKGYPRLIKDDFPGAPINMDTAFVWNGATYFFRGDKYWRYLREREPPISSAYPKPIAHWKGLPETGIDAAYQPKSGPTFFFRGNSFYRFDDDAFQVIAAKPAYPRPITTYLFRCKSQTESGKGTGAHHQSQSASNIFPQWIKSVMPQRVLNLVST